MIEARTKNHSLRRSNRMKIGAVIASLAMLIGVIPASATYYAGGVGTNRFSVQITGVGDSWNAHLKHGITKWNATFNTTGVLISNSSSSQRKMTAAQYSQTWLGLYSPSGTRANRSFLIQANSRETASMSPAPPSDWARHVSVHELGHALSLADNPAVSQISVMKYPSASSYPYQNPTGYDISEVAAFY